MRENGHFTLQFYHGKYNVSSMFNILFPHIEGEEKMSNEVFNDITHRIINYLNNNGFKDKILQVGDNRFIFDIINTYINKDEALLIMKSACYFVIKEYENEITENDLDDTEKAYLKFNVEHLKMLLEDIQNDHYKYIVTEC